MTHPCDLSTLKEKMQGCESACIPLFEKGDTVGMVFDIQRFSLYDGPGVRTVVFLKGCPLRCIWCHNREGLSSKPQILFDHTRCIGCMDCVDACPEGCHLKVGEQHTFDRTACTACGSCAGQCCTGALRLAGMEMTPEEVMEQVLRDCGVYQASGGGMTLSGGEPFAQPEFALRLLRHAKEAGLHTAVETSGYTTADIIREAVSCTDLFLYDYKVTDPERHQMLCGVTNERILRNLKLLDTLGAEVILRCPIVPGMNDSLDHIRGIGEVAVAYGCIKAVHLEPYHRLGLDKAARLGQTDIFDTAPPGKDRMEQYRSSIEAHCGRPTYIDS